MNIILNFNEGIEKNKNEDYVLSKRILTAKDIAEKPYKYYGMKVTNYMCHNKEAVSAWQVFYADSNIYLIANDCIQRRFLPTKRSIGEKFKYTIACDDIIKICNDYRIIDIDDRVKKWLSCPIRNDYDSIKMVLYLLDTQIWKNFANEKAEYAIGTPTFEMFVESHNNKYPNQKIEMLFKEEEYEYMFKYYTRSNMGKNIFWGGEWTNHITLFDFSMDSQYVLQDNSYSHEYSMAFASPVKDERLVTISNSLSTVYHMVHYEQFGLRPIICLKEDVSLEVQENGTSKIV